MWNRSLMAALAACGMLVAAGCEKQDNPMGTYDHGDQQKGPDSADRTFMVTAAQSNLAEIAMGRLATEKSSNADVKSFGHRMVEDHTKANQALTELAQKKGLTLPAKAGEEQERELSQLSGHSGADFDRKFAGMMVRDHESAVSLFQDCSRKSKDPDVRTFATETLPVLEEHLKMARDLNTKLASGTSAY